MLINPAERGICLMSNFPHGRCQVNGNVVHEVLLLVFLSAKDFPELSGLLKVGISRHGLEVNDRPDPLFVIGSLLVLSCLDDWGRKIAGEVVGQCAIVHDVIGSITLRGIVGVERAIDRKLVVVDAEPVALGVSVRKEADLKNWVR